MWQDLVIKEGINVGMPLAANFLKPFLTAEADKAIVGETRKLAAALPQGSKSALYAGWAIDALASAWGV